MCLKGKKLLIMGGPALACDIVKKAKSLGIHTIVTDWYPDYQSPAKQISDESLMISTVDVNALVELIKNENIDGVITGFTDSTLPYYHKVCEIAGLPCYITVEQIEISNNKRRFKELCNEFGIPVVEEYEINDSSDFYKINNIEFPVIVKPVDNSGGRGISICSHQEEFISAFERAVSFSTAKSVIAERYIEAKEATIFYTLNNGEIFLTGIADRHMKNKKEGIIPLPVAYTFPSLYMENYLKKLNLIVIKMFKSVGMKNGMLFIQSFIKNGKFIFYEMGYRLTGSMEYKIMEPIIGINTLQQMIRYSLTGDMGELQALRKLNPKYNSFACNITFLAKPGKISKIEGIETLLSFPEVVDVFQSYWEGDVIPETATGTLQQVIIRVFAVTKRKSELKLVMDEIHNVLKVTGTNGEDLLLEKFNTTELLNE